MEGAVLAGDALTDDARTLVDEHRRRSGGGGSAEMVGLGTDLEVASGISQEPPHRTRQGRKEGRNHNVQRRNKEGEQGLPSPLLSAPPLFR